MTLAASNRYMSDFAPARPNRESTVLYNAAISALDMAIAAIERNDVDARSRAVYRATDVITTLYLRLDIKSSGESADDLADIYGHILGCLVGINFYDDPGIARDTIELIRSLKEQPSVEIGMVSAYTPLKKFTPVNDGSMPEHGA